MTAPPPAKGAKVGARHGPHLSHSQQGPGCGRPDTARTWVRPPQAYTSTALPSAHSRPAQHPGGHSCRLGGQGEEPEVHAWFPHWLQSPAQLLPGADQARV